MKLIIAVIQPDMLNQVRESLVAAGITRITVSRCTGRGKATDEETLYRGQTVAPTLIPKIRLDIACNDDFVDTCVQSIMKAAKHGEKGAIGDGKIFVVPLEQVYRIRTEESGGEAI
ncbi:MAG: P-II family nitrogen regulator [Deltaproteobacteria bacterium]|nr:P-II family nitrogen regulator [Deltaproteobacteria bacterium]MBN2673015.1 P-II family nitrogen regulator [Deltaproteobacteria bacterium]